MKDISSAKQYIFDSEEDAAKAADFYRAQTGFKKMMEMPGHHLGRRFANPWSFENERRPIEQGAESNDIQGNTEKR
jgi:hypothetical protein